MFPRKSHRGLDEIDLPRKSRPQPLFQPLFQPLLQSLIQALAQSCNCKQVRSGDWPALGIVSISSP